MVEETKPSFFTTLPGIITAVAALITAIVGYLTYRAAQDDGPRAQSSCSVSGYVFEDSSDQPFSSVRVGAVPAGSTFVDEEQFGLLATTGPDGAYDLDCSDVSATIRPAVLALDKPGWGGCIYVTGLSVPQEGSRTNVRLSVDNVVMTTLGELWGLPKNDNCERP